MQKFLEIRCSDIDLYLSNQNIFWKTERNFVDWFVMSKNLSQFFEIRFHLPDICISKTCVKQGNSEIRKLGLEDGFDYHIM